LKENYIYNMAILSISKIYYSRVTANEYLLKKKCGLTKNKILI